MKKIYLLITKPKIRISYKKKKQGKLAIIIKRAVMIILYENSNK